MRPDNEPLGPSPRGADTRRGIVGRLFSPEWGSKVPAALWVVLSIGLLLAVTDMGNMSTIAPKTALMEDAICARYYGALVSETAPSQAVRFGTERCKAEPVQSELALVVGWSEALDTIPGIVFALPYGILADRIGRKKVMVLCLIGLFLGDCWVRVVLWFPNVFSTRLVWLSGLWQVVGGGATTNDSMRNAMIADVCPDSKRLTAFLWLQIAKLVSDFIAMPLGAGLMSLDLWYPMWTATGTMLLAIALTIILVPETYKPQEAAGAAQGGADVDETSGLLAAPGDQEDYEPLASHQRREPVGRLGEGLRWLRHNIGAVSIISTFFLYVVGRQASQFVLLYASKRFHWSYAGASILLSLQSALNLLVVTVIIPAISSLLGGRLGLGPAARDKCLTQLSGVCLVLGSLTVALGASPALLVLGQSIFALGLAFHVTARSFATAMVDQRHIGIIYTAMAVMMYAGIVAGSPLMAASFRWGLVLGEFWYGLPFLLATGAFAMAVLAVSVVGVHHVGVESPRR